MLQDFKCLIFSCFLVLLVTESITESCHCRSTTATSCVWVSWDAASLDSGLVFVWTNQRGPSLRDKKRMRGRSSSGLDWSKTRRRRDVSSIQLKNPLMNASWALLKSANRYWISPVKCQRTSWLRLCSSAGRWRFNTKTFLS